MFFLRAISITYKQYSEVHCAPSLHSLPQAMPNNLGHRPVDPLAGLSAHLMHRRVAQSRCLEPRKPPSPLTSPVGDLFPVLARAIRLVVHACITALQGLQINCFTLKWLP